MAGANRGPLLSTGAVLFGLLALSNLLKPLQFGGEQTGFMFFGHRLSGTANMIIGPSFGLYLLTYAAGIWRMRRYAIAVGWGYAAYVLLNLVLFSLSNAHPPGVGYMVFGIVYFGVAVGVSVGTAYTLTTRLSRSLYLAQRPTIKKETASTCGLIYGARRPDYKEALEEGHTQNQLRCTGSVTSPPAAAPRAPVAPAGLRQAVRLQPPVLPLRLLPLLLLLLLGCTRTDPSDARSRTLPETLRVPVALTEPTALPFPRSLAADADYLYWTNYDARTVNRIAKAGGAPEVLAHTGVDPGSLHVDGQRLYLAHVVGERRAGESIGAVSMWAKQDWQGRELARVDGRITDLAVSDTHVYFATETAVMRVAKEGGAPVTLATAQQAFSVVADADAVFFADYGQGTINRVATSGGPVLALARDLSGPRSLTADATHLYWITFDRRLMRVAKTGGPATTLLRDVGLYDTCDTGIAVDAAHLYVTSCCDPGSNSGRILDVQPADGTATVMAKDVTKPCNPVADAGNVYWSTTTMATQHAVFPGGVIFKIVK